MADIDISKIGEKWKDFKEYAQKADELSRESDEKNQRSDGKLNLDSVFEKQTFIRLARAGNKTDEQIKSFFSANGADMNDIDKIFNIELNNTQKQQSAPNKKSNERANATSRNEFTGAILSEGARYYKNANGTFRDTVDWAGIANAFVSFYTSPDSNVPNKEYAGKLASEVVKVANLMKDVKYDSRNDIEKIYKQVNAQLKALGKDEFSEFRDSVLKSFVVLAEQHQKDKEQQKISAEFDKLRKEGKTRAEAYDSIQHDDRFRGSYYHDTWNRTQSEVFSDMDAGHKTVKLHKGLIHKMEDGIILEDARKEVYDAAWAQRGKAHLTTAKQIDNEVEKLITKDKYTNKIMNKGGRSDMSTGQRIRFERSDYKDWRKAIAAYNSVENNKGTLYSRDDFYQLAFKGTKSDSRFNQLARSGNVIGTDGKPVLDKDGNPLQYRPLITQAVDANGKPVTDKDGNPLYNLSRLSDLIKSRISPADMRANYEDRTDPEAEIRTIISDVKRITAVTTKGADGKDIVVQEGIDISYEDACKLIDMCGFERDKWDLAQVLRTLGRAAVDTVKNMATAATTALIVGAAHGNPLVHVEEAITHVSDPTVHAVSNIDQISKALLAMSVNLGTIIPDNGVNLNLNWRINVNVNGEDIDVNSAINRYEIKQQLDEQLREYIDKGVDYGIRQESDGFWHLWISIPPDTPYDDIRNMSEILGANFDLKTDTGVEFYAAAVVDENGKVIVDKPAEAVVDDSGKPSTTKKIQGFLWGTAIGYALNVIQRFAQGLDKSDNSIISTKIDTDNFAEYSQQLASESKSGRLNPRLKDAILELAQLFYVDGKWNSRAYENFLREIAGGRSRLNRKELLFGIEKYNREHSTTVEIKEPEKKFEAKPKADATVDAGPVSGPSTQNKSRGPVVSTVEFATQEDVSANYHFGNKHTWQGIAALYDECKQHGHTQTQIVRAIKQVNGINPDDNVIPKDLYLPDFLFGENDGKKAQLSDKDAEKLIYARDKKLGKDEITTDVRSHGVNITFKRTKYGYKGVRDGKPTKDTFPTREAALNAAKDPNNIVK